MVDEGIAFVQLRMKDRPDEEIYKTADLMRKITYSTDTRFIINDRPDIAKKVGADGCHVGQDDMSYQEARVIVGPSQYIGISTHSPEQTLAACAFKPDYIGIGPVFPTPTKKNADPAIGIDGAKKMLVSATVPAVVLGSITLENLPDLLWAGVRNFSMVRPIMQAEDPASVIQEAMQIWQEYVM
jgi:thiamine-phosphate pyrophosphorylase